VKKLTAALCLLLAILTGASAQTVTEEMAAAVARNFPYEKFNQYVQPTGYNEVEIRETLTWEEGGETLLYIFNMKSSGFVIVALI
jgi:hypothetical protein